MLNEGTFYVLTIGKMYVRYPDAGIVGQNIAHAKRFYDVDAATEAFDKLVTMRNLGPKQHHKKKIGLYKIVVKQHEER